MISSLKKSALFYFNLGLNVVNIGGNRNLYNSKESNFLKAPNHAWKHLAERRQSIDEFNIFSWSASTGVGVVLGYENLMAIDIDGVVEFRAIEEICKILEIPIGYKWIVKTGSNCGYHILLKCNNRPINHTEEFEPDLKTGWSISSGYDYAEKFGTGETNAYYPDFYSRSFVKMEFKWSGNVVLPPSLHFTSHRYYFLFGEPQLCPIDISFEKLQILKESFCSLQSSFSEFENWGTYKFVENDIENEVEMKGVVKQFPAPPDEKYFLYETKRTQPYLAFAISPFKIKKVVNSTLIQISWFILDKNYNVIKRKIFNYFSLDYTGNVFLNEVTYETAIKINDSSRAVFMEFLFDLDHCNNIITYSKEKITFLQMEILKSGLYLDAFKEGKLNNSESHTIYFQQLKDKNIICITKEENENFLAIREQYHRAFNKRFSYEMNSMTELLLIHQFFLKQMNINNDVPKNLGADSAYRRRKFISNRIDFNSYDDNVSYEKYGGAFGFDDDSIDNAFEGDPENYWNID